MIQIKSNIIRTDVTFVKCFHQIILAGVGGNLHVFKKTGELLQTLKIFEGQKIHGISPSSQNRIAIYGANLLKMVWFDFSENRITEILVDRSCADWILGLQWLDDDTRIITVFAKNFVSLFVSEGLTVVSSVGCEEKCVLYSACLANNYWRSVFVFSGTTFGYVLIWKPACFAHIAPVLWRLAGHSGAIFSINYDPTINVVATTSDDRTIRLWPVSHIFRNFPIASLLPITSEYILFAHVARIFRCKIINGLVLTSSEGSLVCVWSVNGKFERKFETHQGGCVWALDYSPEDQVIITGGGDCGISIYPLHVSNRYEELKLRGNEIARALRLTAMDNFVLVLDSGMVRYYNAKERVWSDVCFYEDLRSYAVLETSESKELISLANFYGTIRVYKEQNSSLIKLCTYDPESSERIFTMKWLSCDQFLTSTLNGVMNMWRVKENEDHQFSLFMEYDFVLPQIKERWFTAATLCFRNLLAVGDRKANIHLYKLGTRYPLMTSYKNHAHLGITHLRVVDHKLVSIGRDGCINTYLFLQNRLVLTTRNKLPFNWLVSVIVHLGEVYVAGFMSVNFIIFNLNTRQFAAYINCNGGHRSFDVKLTVDNAFNFLYVKDRNHINLFTVYRMCTPSCDLIPGYHAREVNAGIIVKPFENENKILVVTGGEDTTVRVSLTDMISSFRSTHTLKSHLSSVRSITHCAVDSNTYLLFSGGGRAHVITWLLTIQPDNHEKTSCHLVDSFYKQSEEIQIETRVMDMLTIRLDEDCVLLVTGCSDGTIRNFTLSEAANFKLEFHSSLFFAYQCIIKIMHVEICSSNLIVTLSVNGTLTFWDFTQLCKDIEETSEILQVTPFFSLQIHQSGINCCAAKTLPGNLCLFATGGDDNAVALHMLYFERSDFITAHPVTRWINETLHGAQVTGIFLDDNYVITASVDQHIVVLKWKFIDYILSCSSAKEFCSAISDIQGMRCIPYNNGLCIFVHGKGIEICTLKFD